MKGDYSITKVRRGSSPTSAPSRRRGKLRRKKEVSTPTSQSPSATIRVFCSKRIVEKLPIGGDGRDLSMPKGKVLECRLTSRERMVAEVPVGEGGGGEKSPIRPGKMDKRPE